MNLRPCTLLAIGLSVSSLAVAQEPDEPSGGGMSFDLDPVFVSRFEPANEVWKADAERIRSMLEARLGGQFLLVGRDEVPAFPDYSAETYLESCPPAEFFGCAFVIGDRAQAEWVVTGRVGEGTAAPEVEVVFIDVVNSRAVFSFSAEVGDEEEAAFGDAVARLLDQILAGAVEEEDLRGDLVDPAEERARLEAEQEALAAALAEMEGELDAMARTMPIEELEDPKLTREDLVGMRDREEAAPWERLSMSETEYLRFKNSGKTLNDWRYLASGRFGRVVLSAGAGGGGGPWGQQFDARTALDDMTLAVVEVEQYQEVQNGSVLFADLEIGLGVHKWLEVGFAMSPRSASYSFLFHSEVEGQTATVDDPSKVSMSSVQWGPRVHFAPMATWSFRPTATAGLAFWKGTSIDRISEIPPRVIPLAAPKQVFIELGPGAEVDAGRHVTVYGRMLVEVPFAGDQLQLHHEGSAALQNRATPDGDYGTGLQFGAGVRVRLGPFVEMKPADRGYDD